jgi:hypothetical protein
MVHSVDTLIARIHILEIRIQSLLALNTPHKALHKNGFRLFAQSIRSHIRSQLFHTLHTHPTNTDIIKEISAIWNHISTEEKSHWLHLA